MKIKTAIFLIIFSLTACDDNTPLPEGLDFRQEMRDFVTNLSIYAKNINSDFIIIPQNGQELITDNGEVDGIVQTEYLQHIDATGRESMFYGYYKDDEITPDEDTEHLLNLCRICENYDIEVLATDYCYTPDKVNDSYQKNAENDFISFAANKRELNEIPNYPNPIYNENSNDILKISDAKNFLYLINGENFATKNDLIFAVSQTNYDLILIDLFHNDEIFTASEIEQLKVKKSGANRLVISYISVAEAEDYRYYWQADWATDKPDWLEPENPDWEGNYKVRYWDAEWQALIYGNDNSYMKKISDAGFDGAYLDIIDAFEYFEEDY